MKKDTDLLFFKRHYVGKSRKVMHLRTTMGLFFLHIFLDEKNQKKTGRKFLSCRYF